MAGISQATVDDTSASICLGDGTEVGRFSPRLREAMSVSGVAWEEMLPRVYEDFVREAQRRLSSVKRPVLRLFPPHAPSSHAQGSSGIVATVPLVWRGHTKSTAARSGPGPDLAMWLE